MFVTFEDNLCYTRSVRQVVPPEVCYVRFGGQRKQREIPYKGKSLLKGNPCKGKSLIKGSSFVRRARFAVITYYYQYHVILSSLSLSSSLLLSLLFSSFISILLLLVLYIYIYTYIYIYKDTINMEEFESGRSGGRQAVVLLILLYLY